MADHTDHTDHTDLTAGVLVIGGGLAGAWAALSAAQQGADVILVDKGYCGTSGVTATAGVGHWYLPPEARDAEVAERSRAGGDLTEPDWMHATMEMAWQRLPELDPYYPWPVRDGRPDRRSSVRGPEYMRLMRARARRAGVTILDHHPATELLLHEDGSVGGASGLRLQEGGTWMCSASAVILATGGTAFLSRLLGANNNTADGHLMAAEVGARFSGMEFSCFYTVAAAHSTMTRVVPVHVRHLPGLRRQRAGLRELQDRTPEDRAGADPGSRNGGTRSDAQPDQGTPAARPAQLPAPATARWHRPVQGPFPGHAAR